MKLAPLPLFALVLLVFSAPIELTAAVSSENERWFSESKIRRDRTALQNRDFAARVPRSFGSSATAQLRCLSKVPGVYQRLCDDVLNSEYLLKPDNRLTKMASDAFGQPRLCASFTRQARRADRPAVLRLVSWRDELLSRPFSTAFSGRKAAEAACRKPSA